LTKKLDKSQQSAKHKLSRPYKSKRKKKNTRDLCY